MNWPVCEGMLENHMKISKITAVCEIIAIRQRTEFYGGPCFYGKMFWGLFKKIFIKNFFFIEIYFKKIVFKKHFSKTKTSPSSFFNGSVFHTKCLCIIYSESERREEKKKPLNYLWLQMLENIIFLLMTPPAWRYFE